MSYSSRKEKDAMGAVDLPVDALYGIQTQRAINNFAFSGLTMPRAMIYAIGSIKQAAAEANRELGLLNPTMADAIAKAAAEVADGTHDHHFPVDIFQTGSGTSSHMNANEVIATVAGKRLGAPVHPNNHVNLGQSSNDVFPSAIHVAARTELAKTLSPAVGGLIKFIETRSGELVDVVKSGRTHLMDAVPLTMGQELSAWASQLRQGLDAISSTHIRLEALALGGTAVGTGLNTHPDFGEKAIKHLARMTGVPFSSAVNKFHALASPDAMVELSGQLKGLAVTLMKISNDLRWMNSGPHGGLGEIELPPLQPGSSIMPGKVNPVIPEAVAQVCAQVIGLDAAVTVAGQSGNFQLNVMLPLIAHNLISCINLLGRGAEALGTKAIAGFTVNRERIGEMLAQNPMLVTALNPVIGYELGAKIAKWAYRENRPIMDVAEEMTDLDRKTLHSLMDPAKLVKGGIIG